MKQHDLLKWYESSLPPHERKRRGHFSTPPDLVERILDACGYTIDQDLSRLRILDPACGSGNILAGAARRLLNYGKLQQLSPRALTRLLQQHIWGFDPDPVACFLADMQLRLLCQEHDISITHGLHVHQADSLTIPWENETIDLFLANPPYLAAKNMDLSGYLTSHERGQTDSYFLFLHLSLQIVKPGGWIALIIPDSFLARTNATLERQRVLAETTVHQLWHLANVFTAYVGAVVIIAQKLRPATDHLIHWQRENWNSAKHNKTTEQTEMATTSIEKQTTTQTIPQRLISTQPNAEMRYLISSTQGTFATQLQTCLYSSQKNAQGSRKLAFLSEFLTIKRGEELGKNSSYLQQKPDTTDRACWHPVLRGGIDVRPYAIPQAEHWIKEEHIHKPLDRYLTPKILVVKSAGRLQATLDLQGHVILQTLYTLQLVTTTESDISVENELYFYLALLNSRLLQEYVYLLHTAYKWVQPQIEQHVLAHLPIPLAIDKRIRDNIILRARDLEQISIDPARASNRQENYQKCYDAQEKDIYALYQNCLKPGKG